MHAILSVCILIRFLRSNSDPVGLDGIKVCEMNQEEFNKASAEHGCIYLIIIASVCGRVFGEKPDPASQ